uniref:Uncharacterized protein n=1 Tax=Avena sativa TaxID=4498 RepID=A0ACD5YB14_AVESA
MASSPSMAIPATTAADERDRKRKRGGEPGTDGTRPRQHAPCKWRTRREHEIYSTKLLDALRLVRAGGVLLPSSRAREVRDAADRALAVAARGRSRWSRAILLASRSRSRARLVRAKARAPTPAPRRPSTDASSSCPASAPALARKAKELGRLVPGCRKLPFPALLSEASDYIAALEMQVRAMAALAQALSSVAPSSSSSSRP